MKLFSYTLLAGAFADLDIVPYNFRVWKTRTSRLFVKWDQVGPSAASDWNVVVTESATGRVAGNIKDGRNPENTAREVQRLKPRTKYTITVRASDGDNEGPEASWEAFTSPRPVQSGKVSAAFHTGVQLEWEAPDGGADQYRIANLNDENEQYFSDSNTLYVNMIPGEKKVFTIQSVSCDDCSSPPNEAWGKPLEVEAVSIPPAPLKLELSDITIENFETADAKIMWENPAVGEWDHVKVEYSPNLPAAKTATPSYIPSGWSQMYTVEGLYQNTVYTITVRFVSNNVEGPAESYSWGIPDGLTKKAPKVQNCQVPTYLRPEGLIVKRDVFEHSMNVAWDHPRAKKPEMGYRLVFAPFSHISEQKPWIENVDKDTTNFRLSGPKYDPYEEYTVSLIALHDEQLDDPHSPDFIATHFTGTYLKNQGKSAFVAPDACCGSERHNSKSSSCCGGSLIEDESGFLCCKNMPYTLSTNKCCNNGRLIANTDNC